MAMVRLDNRLSNSYGGASGRSHLRHESYACTPSQRLSRPSPCCLLLQSLLSPDALALSLQKSLFPVSCFLQALLLLLVEALLHHSIRFFVVQLLLFLPSLTELVHESHSLLLGVVVAVRLLTLKAKLLKSFLPGLHEGSMSPQCLCAATASFHLQLWPAELARQPGVHGVARRSFGCELLLQPLVVLLPPLTGFLAALLRGLAIDILSQLCQFLLKLLAASMPRREVEPDNAGPFVCGCPVCVAGLRCSEGHPRPARTPSLALPLFMPIHWR
mmetsp:Transcript_44548/g.80056  ORF Transcript_44548/g.80056 Transcript_44548/m.80056 type:complete len:273 (-) Transcript_44548:399-1217(-)